MVTYSSRDNIYQDLFLIFLPGHLERASWLLSSHPLGPAPQPLSFHLPNPRPVPPGSSQSLIHDIFTCFSCPPSPLARTKGVCESGFFSPGYEADEGREESRLMVRFVTRHTHQNSSKNKTQMISGPGSSLVLPPVSPPLPLPKGNHPPAPPALDLHSRGATQVPLAGPDFLFYE